MFSARSLYCVRCASSTSTMISSRVEHRVLFTLVIAELMDQGENEGFVGLQIVPQLLTVLRLAFLFLPNHFRLYKILVDLVIQVFAIGDDQECEIARRSCAEPCGRRTPWKRICRNPGCARTRQACPAAPPGSLPIPSSCSLRNTGGFGNDLVLLIAEHDEVFYVVDQPAFLQQAVDEIPDRNFRPPYRLPSKPDGRPILLGVHLQPLEEMIVGGVEGAEPCLQPVGQHADLIERKQVRDIRR